MSSRSARRNRAAKAAKAAPLLPTPDAFKAGVPKRLGAYKGGDYKSSLGEENARRTTAFKIMGNKQVSSQAKVKSQMCRSVAQGIACSHGDRCTYAHSQCEIRKPKCQFGKLCRWINKCDRDHGDDYVPPIVAPVLPEPCTRPIRHSPVPSACPSIIIQMDDDEDEIVESEYDDSDEKDAEDILSLSLDELSDRLDAAHIQQENDDSETAKMMEIIDMAAKGTIVYPTMTSIDHQRMVDESIANPMGTLYKRSPSSVSHQESPVPFASDVEDMESRIRAQEMHIQHQQSEIDRYHYHFHTPRIPVVLTLAQYLQLTGGM